MEHKVLIADDSLTIQKVIKITLANEPFELSVCSEAENLVEMVKELKPSVALLDFNLSENKTGYDLCREIKEANPAMGVLMLFGTFDNIDETLLSDCGCNHYIVKPFDGSKFINLCRTLVAEYQSTTEGDEGEAQAEPTIPEPIEEETEVEAVEFDDSRDEDEWVVNQPAWEDKTEKVELPESFKDPLAANKLEMEVEEWGMEVPSVIGKESDESEMELPEVIEAAPTKESAEAAFPSSEDLEYPDMIDSEPEESETPDEPKSKLISVDDLNIDEELEFDTPEQSMSFGGTDTEEGVRKLEEQIKDELEEEEELWAADIIEEGEPEADATEEADFDSADEEFQPFDISDMDQVAQDWAPLKPHTLREVNEGDGVPADFPADIMSETAETAEAVPAMDMGQLKQELLAEAKQEILASMKEEIANELKAQLADLKTQVMNELSTQMRTEFESEVAERLQPLAETKVRDYCNDHVDKVAWEVIPDLAENIIKKEIQKISDSLID